MNRNGIYSGVSADVVFRKTHIYLTPRAAQYLSGVEMVDIFYDANRDVVKICAGSTFKLSKQKNSRIIASKGLINHFSFIRTGSRFPVQQVAENCISVDLSKPRRNAENAKEK
jgi:hypothetical protein